jgi:hypothetical protein
VTVWDGTEFPPACYGDAVRNDVKTRRACYDDWSPGMSEYMSEYVYMYIHTTVGITQSKV